MTIQQAYRGLLAQLYEVYDTREAANIADWVIENVTGQRKIERIVYKDLPVTAQQQEQLNEVAGKLLRHIPVQYVLGESWFAGMKLYVNEQVLIPRPETEELVEWIRSDLQQSSANGLRLLDVGTGSGCIPIALKKAYPGLQAIAIDVSEGAIAVAKKNAHDQQTPVEFKIHDFLNKDQRQNLGSFDIIISNPPYIKQSEAVAMSKNVLSYEPHAALFVPDDNALLFYEAIASFGKEHLSCGGSVYLEINEQLGNEVVALFEQNGFTGVELRKDMQGKDRMVKGTLTYE